MTPKNNWVGETVGGLLVLELVYYDKKQEVNMYKCRCQCGNEIVRSSANLSKIKKYNKTAVCTQCKKDWCRKLWANRRNSYNQYDLSGTIGIGYIGNDCFYFDLEDYDLISKYKWWKNASGHILTTYLNKTIWLHHLVLNIFDGLIDHIDRNPANNQKQNLRVCTKQQNCCNSKMYSNNTSGRKGVSYDKSRGQWIAFISYKRQFIRRRCSSFEEAVLQREEWENIYHKEFKGESI